MTRLSIALSLVLVVACSKKEAEPPPATETPTAPAAESAPVAAAGGAAEEAKQTFATLCSTCHGTTGTGDGPASATLDPRPRNYTDKAWQATVTDEQIRQIILEGGAAVGKSPMMPPSPQFKDKPEVVTELVKIVRSFAQ